MKAALVQSIPTMAIGLRTDCPLTPPLELPHTKDNFFSDDYVADKAGAESQSNSPLTREVILPNTYYLTRPD